MRERYYAFVAEHEVILIPRKELLTQVKRFTDAIKVTTLDPEYAARTQPYTVIEQDVWEGYLNKLGYPKDQFIKD